VRRKEVITNPDKLSSRRPVTRSDLARYYAAVAEGSCGRPTFTLGSRRWYSHFRIAA
jgi:hypothetical protein